MKTIHSFLCLIAFFSVSVMSNAQTFEAPTDDLDYQEPHVVAQIINQQSNINQAQIREEYQVDSIYVYEDELANLTLRLVYEDHNANSDWSVRNEDEYINQSWEPSEKTTDTYNTDLLRESRITMEYINNEFVNDFKSEYEYDNLGRITQRTNSNYNLDLETWEPFDKTEYTYVGNSTNFDLISNFDFEANDWVPDNISAYTYNNDLIQEYIRTDFDPVTQSFSETNKRTYFYDPVTNLRDSSFLYRWSDVQDWELWRRYNYEFQYDQISYYQYDRYDPEFETWIPFFKFEITFSDFDRYLYRDFYLFDTSNEEYYFDFREEYFQSSNPLDVDPAINSSIKIDMANPFSEDTPITISGMENNQTLQLSLIGMKGQILFEKEIDSNTTIYLPNSIPSGTYFLNLTENGQVIQNKKVVKMK